MSESKVQPEPVDALLLSSPTEEHGIDIRSHDFRSLESHFLFQTGRMKIVSRVKAAAHLAENPSVYSLAVLRGGTELKLNILSGILDPFLREFTDLYRQIFADSEWKEYICCGNSNCPSEKKVQLAIQDTPGYREEYGDAIVFERATSFDPASISCSSCQQPMTFFYDPEQTFQHFRREFQKDFTAGLLWNDSSELVGFTAFWPSSVRKDFHDKLIVGTGDKPGWGQTYEDYIREIQSIFQDQFGIEVNEDSAVFNCAEWGIRPKERSFGFGLLPFLVNLEQMDEIDAPKYSHHRIPLMGTAFIGSKAHVLLMQLGWREGVKLPENKVRTYHVHDILLQNMKKKVDRLFEKGILIHNS